MADRKAGSLRERAAARTRPGGDLPDPPVFEPRSDGAPPVDARLLIWLSPAFPVGAFAYSHGLELAADRGWVCDRAGLAAWLGDLVEVGSLRNDLILLASAWRAATIADAAALVHANALALALQPSAERRLETVTQGNAFTAAVRDAWARDAATDAIDALTGDIAYPVAVGAWTGVHAMPLAGTLQAYALAFVSNLVSAAIRLSIVGQTDGQRVIAGLMPAIQSAAQAALDTTFDDVGTATLRGDVASLAHETQYSRLFRS